MRNSSPAASAATHTPLAATSPSVPLVIRELLQIPETPAPAPRRPVRRRFDNNGRRLPAGPPPPQSWTQTRPVTSSALTGTSVNATQLRNVTLPADYLPQNGSLIDIILRQVARNWELHQTYDQYHLFWIPSHLKPALIRYISTISNTGLGIADLRAFLQPPTDEYIGHGDEPTPVEITVLDLSGSIETSFNLKHLGELLFPQRPQAVHEPTESWESEDSSPPSPQPALLPHLSHLSLALNPGHAKNASWKQLLNLAPKLSTITHLSLAYWPVPALTRRAQSTVISSPQGRNIPYGGTNLYSHSLDQDWSEALLVLKMLSKHLYALEFLDLTGCGAWFKALMLQDGQDYVDWSSNWGKISTLRLHNGVIIDDESLPSQRIEYRENCETAAAVEKHIIAMRAGRGRFLNVERNRIDMK